MIVEICSVGEEFGIFASQGWWNEYRIGHGLTDYETVEKAIYDYFQYQLDFNDYEEIYVNKGEIVGILKRNHLFVRRHKILGWIRRKEEKSNA